MALQTFRISPSQWVEFDTYEARFQIETMCRDSVTILCDNIVISPYLLKKSLLPDFFTLKENIYPKIDRVRLTFSSVSYLKLRGTLFDPHTNEWIESSEKKQIVLVHSWGETDATKFVYELSGVGRLTWPSISTDEFVIEASDHLSLVFDDKSYYPTGFRSPEESEQAAPRNS